jgi:hypothetical protein
METVTFEVTGTYALMMNAPNSLLNGGTGPGIKRIPEPKEEAELGAYRAPSGQLYMPTNAFRKALVTAGRDYKEGRKSYGGIFMGSVFAPEAPALLFDPDTRTAITDYEIDVRRAVPPKQGAVRRARPRLERWACQVTFEYDDRILPGDKGRKLMEQVLNDAGARFGVGSYRPEKGGPFGRFTASLVE